MQIGWLKVLAAAALEIIWITGLKYAAGPAEWCGTIIAWALCTYCFITASDTLPVGTAYCVFTGLGALGTVLVEVFYFYSSGQHTAAAGNFTDDWYCRLKIMYG